MWCMRLRVGIVHRYRNVLFISTDFIKQRIASETSLKLVQKLETTLQYMYRWHDLKVYGHIVIIVINFMSVCVDKVKFDDYFCRPKSIQ